MSGAPITGEQLLAGCRGDDDAVTEIAYYPCRGTGNVVAAVVHRGRGWSGELAMAWEEKAVAGRTYGTWGGGYPWDPSADANADVAGCVISWPDVVEPSPS